MLSLSLAFILSQDQTLRCYNCFLFNLFRPGRLLTYSVQAVSFIDGVQFTFFCLYFLFSCLCKSYSKNSSFFRKRGAKVMLFYLYLQIFSEVFFLFSRTPSGFAWASQPHRPHPEYLITTALTAISLDCGCKGRYFFSPHQMFLPLFLKEFLSVLIFNSLYTPTKQGIYPAIRIYPPGILKKPGKKLPHTSYKTGTYATHLSKCHSDNLSPSFLCFFGPA